MKMTYQLTPTWTTHHHSSGPPPAAVHIRNLASVIYGAADAWGRRGKAQPVLVSASIAFKHAFPTAAATDRLGLDTVHYGTLAKSLLADLERYTEPDPDNDDGSLLAVLNWLWSGLTGRSVGSSAVVVAEETAFLRAEHLAGIASIELTLTLPKASLLGSGVSLTTCCVFERGVYSLALRVEDLCVPTLVGVNDNERLARQVVRATVTLDGFPHEGDPYVDVERVVVKAMTESSFETLEALGAYIAQAVAWKYGHGPANASRKDMSVHVRMEKPSAVPLADCPVVEIRMGLADLAMEEVNAPMMDEGGDNDNNNRDLSLGSSGFGSSPEAEGR